MITRRSLLAFLAVCGLTPGCKKRRLQSSPSVLGGTVQAVFKNGVAEFDDLTIDGKMAVQIGSHACQAIGVAFAGTVITIAKLTLPHEARTLLGAMRKFNATLTNGDWKYIATGVRPVEGTLHSHDNDTFTLKGIRCECDGIKRESLRKRDAE